MKKNTWKTVLTVVVLLALAAALVVAAVECANGASLANTAWSLLPPVIAIILALITKEAYSALFIGNDAEGYHFIIGSAKKSAQTVLNRLKESLTVRGGGRPEMVEGTVFGSEAAIRASLQV